MTVTFQNHTKLRVCTLSDVPALNKVAVLCFEETFGQVLETAQKKSYEEAHFLSTRLCKEMLHPLMHFVVVTSHARTVAYLKLNCGKMQTEKTFQDGVEIEHLYVLKDFRGKEIGRALVEHAMDYAKEEGLSCLWVCVWEKNPEALSFYEKMGFKKVGTRPSRLGEGKDTILQLAVQEEI